MNTSRIAQFAPLSGVVFVALVAVSAILVNQFEYLPPPADLVELYVEDSARVNLGAYAGVLAAPFLIWFAGSLRHHLRPHEGDSGRLSALAFGGGVAAAALFATSASIVRVAAQRADSASGISADAAVVFNDISAILGGGAFPMVLAVMIGASSLLALRTLAWPAWLGWAGVVVAVGSLTPASYLFIAFETLWILVVSILLYMRERSGSTAAG